MKMESEKGIKLGLLQELMSQMRGLDGDKLPKRGVELGLEEEEENADDQDMGNDPRLMAIIRERRGAVGAPRG